MSAAEKHVVRRPGERSRLARAVPALLLSLVCANATLAQDTAEEAIPSRLASRSLLLDVARAGERLVAVGERGHVLLSDDSGKSWRQARRVPTRVNLTAVAFADARHGWAVGHEAVVIHSADGGETWELQHAAPEEEVPLLSVWFEDASHGIAAGAFALLLETRDGGQTWTRRPLGHSGEDDPHLNEIFAAADGSLFLASEFGWVFRSRDGGESWQRLDPPYEGSFWGGLALDDAGVLVFGMRGRAFRSDDLGDSWTAAPTGADQSFHSAIRLADGTLVMVGLAGVVATSDDAGRSFTTAVEPDRRGIAAVAEGTDGALLLFGEAGVKQRARAPADRK